MPKVEAVPVSIKGQAGYDIVVNDAGATVQDYIDAVDEFIDTQKYYRSRQPGLTRCLGCDLCCQERIPVTIVDSLVLNDAGLEANLRQNLHVYVEGQVVDITMGLDEAGRCLFLEPESRSCRTWGTRPLVCRTFICCPSSPRARMLREEIVNSGEDELVRAWFGVKDHRGRPVIHEGRSPDPHLSDYARTPFHGVTGYSQVKLKDVCSPELWRKLIRTPENGRKKRV